MPYFISIFKAIISALKRVIPSAILHAKIDEGYAFSASHRFEEVSSDAYIDVYFENPADSGRTIHIVTVDVISLAQAHIDIYRNNTKTADGTPITIMNENLGSENESVATVEYNGAYTLGKLASNTVCPGGSHVRAIGGAAEVGETVKIPQGKNILVRVTNKSASSTDLSVKIIWWEE